MRGTHQEINILRLMFLLLLYSWKYLKKSISEGQLELPHDFPNWKGHPEMCRKEEKLLEKLYLWVKNYRCYPHGESITYEDQVDT